MEGPQLRVGKMAASTGIAPASLGLKGRDPELLDDKAVNRGAGIAVYAVRRTSRVGKDTCPSQFHKEHTPSSLSPPEQVLLGRFGRPRDLRAGVG